MNKRDWKIVYSNYSGMERKAVELISREMGALILRDKGVYTIHTLACERESETKPDSNAVVVGLYDESSVIREYIKPDEIPEHGYAVRVTGGSGGSRLALITANEPAALFYGAVDFVDDCFAYAAPMHGSVKLMHEVFDQPLPDYYSASAPAFLTRSVFTWGHVINDYREYFDNMARLKLNQVIIWNDFLPLNARDIVDYAHSCGIKLLWGYAWGWGRKCEKEGMNDPNDIAKEVIDKYDRFYRDTGADGIYFQSFTETNADSIGGELIAERVTRFVNMTAGKIFEREPDLKLVFGLHASSVKDHLSFIAQVDERVEIMWEDCGSFPYGYFPYLCETDDFEATAAFTDRILALRERGGTSMLFKGFMTLDWHGDRFVHQAGPYVMGMNSPRLAEHDRELLSPIWRQYQSGWLQNGKLAHIMANRILKNGGPGVTLGLAGQFAGGIWLPEALCAQILWDCGRPYEEIFDKVTRRTCVDIV